MNGVEPDNASPDITNCDNEPIHIPGSIQPHGVLLALDPVSLKVIQTGGDTVSFFGLASEEIIGRGLETCAGPAAAEHLKSLSGGVRSYLQPVVVMETAVEHKGRLLDAAIYPSEDALIVEFEPSVPSVTDNPLNLLHGMIARVQTAANIGTFLQKVAQEARGFFGFDRVMIYRFQPDESGSVVAEAKADDLEPYLGLHYPASDIPRQARELFLKNLIRVIPNVNYQPLPIIPALNPLNSKPLDLSFSVLRSVSPLHLEYLRNMGVAASMSLSIVIDQKLWGLIACHHRTPHFVSQTQRSIGELFTQLISLQLAEKVATEEQEERFRIKVIHAALVESMLRETDLGAALTRHRPNLIDYISCGGVAVCCDGRASTEGRTPPEEHLHALTGWLHQSVDEGVFITDRLGEIFPPAKAYADVASGLIALSVSRTPKDYVLWFRPEEVMTVTWAGNPEKPYEKRGGGIGISPRKSFEAWQETVRGRSQPWSIRNSDAAHSLRISILETVLLHLDDMMRERERERMQKDILMAELDHRVKNTIATIQALVKFSSDGATDLPEATLNLTERLHAMARTHGMLTQSRWLGVDLETLIAQELEAFEGSGRTRIGGSKIMLRPKAALSVSLAIHELTTNAAKFGALSVAGGWVEIHWQREKHSAKPGLVLHWAEHGGPPVSQPVRRGFGRVLLEQNFAYDVDGQVTLEFKPAGVLCTAVIPIEQIVEEEA